MKIVKFSDAEGAREAWLNWRLGKSTGSKLADLFSKKDGFAFFDPNKPKLAVYRLIAEGYIGSAALAAEESSPEKAMERGHRLEPVAIERFSKESGIVLDWHNDDIGWESSQDSRIAFSPDGSRGKTIAGEAKCLSAARHIQARIENKIPDEYEWQALQAFVVNESLRKLFFIFYDDRFPTGLDFFWFEINRKDKKVQIEALLNEEKQLLAFVRNKTVELAKYLA